MNKSFINIALASILVLINGSNGSNSRLLLGEDINDNKPNYKPRKNEVECSSRRCCSIRDELTPSDLPNDLNCAALADYECGRFDRYCEWDCDEIDPIKNNKNIKRTFRGISSKDGSYQEPALPEHDEFDDNDNGYDNKKLLQKCLSDGAKFISVDDCGVEYEAEIKDSDVICHHLYDEDHHNDREDNADKNDEHRRLQGGGVLGQDGRTKVNNMDAFPYNTVLYMNYVGNGDGLIYKDCTATMISYDMAITAAHCVWSPNGGWIAKNFNFLWNIDDCDEWRAQINARNYYTANTEWVYAAYTQPGGNNAVNDIALIKFNTGGRAHNIMNLGYNNDLRSGASFQTIGYPGDKGDGCTPYEQTCVYQEIYTEELASSTCDHWHGQSGSAIWQWYNGQPVIYAILSSGIDNKNYDCRITPAKFQWICELSNTCPN